MANPLGMKTPLTQQGVNSNISFKDIQKCHSTYDGSKISFLSKLSVFFKAGVWLNDTKIENLLTQSDNVSTVYKETIKQKNSLELKQTNNLISATEQRQLNQLDKHINRMRVIINRALPAMDLSEKTALLKPEETITHSPEPMTREKVEEVKETVQQTTKAISNDIVRERKIEEKQISENIDDVVSNIDKQIHDYIGKNVDLIKEDIKEIIGGNAIEEVSDNVSKIIGKHIDDVKQGIGLFNQNEEPVEALELPGEQVEEKTSSLITAKFLAKLSGSENLIRDAVEGIVDFAQKHMVASNEGHELLKELPQDQRQLIVDLADVNKKITELNKKIEGYESLIKDQDKNEGLKKEISKFNEQLKELEIKKNQLTEIIAPIRQKISEDHVGVLFPTIHTNTVSAVQHHFSDLANALKALKKDHPNFDHYPNNLKGMLISEKIKEMAISAPLAFVPTESALQKAGIDINFMKNVASKANEMLNMEKEIYDLEKEITEVKKNLEGAQEKLYQLEERGVQQGWFVNQTDEDFELEKNPFLGEIQKLEDSRDSKLELLESKRETFKQAKEDYRLGDGPKAAAMNKNLGKLLDKGAKSAELELLSKVTNALIDNVLLPEGIKVSKLLNAALKAKNIEIDDLGKQYITELLWSYVDYYSNPAFLNRQLEPVITKRLEDAKNPPKKEATTPKEKYTEDELIDTILDREPPPLDKEITENYRRLGLDILSIGAPRVGSAVETLTSWVGDFGVAESAHRTIDSTMNAMARGFGNKQIRDGLLVVANYKIESTNEIPPTAEEDEEVHNSVRNGIQEMAGGDVRKASDSAQQAVSESIVGYLSYLVPTSVSETAKSRMNEVTEAAADYASTGAVRLYDITQIKSVNRMLMLSVIGALGSSITEVSGNT